MWLTVVCIRLHSLSADLHIVSGGEWPLDTQFPSGFLEGPSPLSRRVCSPWLWQCPCI